MEARWLISQFLLCFMLPTSFSSQLIQVNTLFRHGDRAPVANYPTGLHPEKDWLPYKFGHLTNIGREQQTRLGRFTRKYYSSLNMKHYFDPDEITVRSSDIERTIISAYSHVAGLYANRSDSIWEMPYVSWQPIPVHSYDPGTDTILLMGRHCTVAKNEDDRLWDSADIHNLVKKCGPFLDTLGTLTGLTDLKKNSLKGLSHLLDVLVCENAHNMTLPAWTKWTNLSCHSYLYNSPPERSVYDMLLDLKDIEVVRAFNSSLAHKFKGGPLVLDIINNMKKITNREESTKLHIYSAHDTTIEAFLSALGVTYRGNPQYASMVMLELYLNEDESYSIIMKHKNVTDSDEVYQRTIPDLDSKSVDKANPVYSFDEFADHFTALYQLKDGWDQACMNKLYAGIFTKQDIIAMIVCGTVLLALISAALICFARRRRISHKYVPVPSW